MTVVSKSTSEDYSSGSSSYLSQAHPGHRDLRDQRAALLCSYCPPCSLAFLFSISFLFNFTHLKARTQNNGFCHSILYTYLTDFAHIQSSLSPVKCCVGGASQSLRPSLSHLINKGGNLRHLIAWTEEGKWKNKQEFTRENDVWDSTHKHFPAGELVQSHPVNKSLYM